MFLKPLAIATSLFVATSITLLLSAPGRSNDMHSENSARSLESVCPPQRSRSPRNNTGTELERLLRQRLDHPENTAAIDAQIHETFVETYAILVMDSSGFSRLSQDQGIIAALAEIERMRGVVMPVIQQHEGSIFKIEVDNVYAVFPTVQQAIAASEDMIQHVRPLDKHVSIGIGYGDLIMISNSVPDGSCYSDVYGEEMNLASKLGEDLAGADEVLLTESAFRQLRDQANCWEPRQMEISGLQLNVYQERP